MVLVLIVFARKYYFGYQLAMDPRLKNQTGFEVAMLGVSGIVTGLFIGRVIAYFYRLNTEPSVDLKSQEQ